MVLSNCVWLDREDRLTQRPSRSSARYVLPRAAQLVDQFFLALERDVRLTLFETTVAIKSGGDIFAAHSQLGGVVFATLIRLRLTSFVFREARQSFILSASGYVSVFLLGILSDIFAGR